MRTKRIGFLAFDGLVALDLVGPMETFATALVDDDHGGFRPGYEVLVLGLTKTFAADSALSFIAGRTLQNAPSLDTLVIPGGSGLRQPDVSAKVTAWLK